MVGKLEQACGEQQAIPRLARAGSLPGCWSRSGILSLFMLIDWMWVLPDVVGALALAADRRSAVFRFARVSTVLRAAARRPRMSRPSSPSSVNGSARCVEYAEPAPRSTVPASPGLLKALGRETDSRTAGLDFRELIPWAIFERRAVGLCSSRRVSRLVALLASPALRTAALRMLLLPVHYTRLNVEPGDLTLKAGDELKLAVTLSGRPVSGPHGLTRGRTVGEWITASLAPDLEPARQSQPLEGRLTASLKDCQADFDYRVVAGEVESPTFHVKVVHPLLLKGLEATITPPPYTRRPPEVVKDGNWSAIEGSRVDVEIQLDRSPATATLALESSREAAARKSIPLQIDGTRLTGVARFRGQGSRPRDRRPRMPRA